MLSTVPAFAPGPFEQRNAEDMRRTSVWRSEESQQAGPAEIPPIDAERKMAIQLMHLASQFHASDYARAKFGARGSALTYIPLSIHLPDHFKELQARQALYPDENAWWLSERSSSIAAAADLLRTGELLPAAPAVTVIKSLINLQDELSSAIETPLTPSAWTPADTPLLKTSETHPLSLSTMIPPDLLSTISLHLSLSSQSSPAMFDIHPAFSLERLTCFPAMPPHSQPPPPPTEPLPRLPVSIAVSATPAAQLQIWNRASMKSALQSALASSIGTPSSMPHIPPLAFGDMDLLGEILARANAAATLDDSSIRAESLAARHERAYSAPPAVFKALLADSIPTSRRVPHFSGKTPYPHPRRNWDVSVMQIPPRRPRLVQIASHIPAQLPRLHIDTPPPQALTPPMLGNLFLSSCPGKKVRLHGPVRGRGAVCRDLRRDLQRIKALGVGCIVCCLDDEELKFLGAPWPEYFQAAQELQLDVLRIPMPEGLAPASPAAFDAHLTRLISSYTLAGTPVLVHCRGGVGRAGLVACCWMLKLGLCGWPAPIQNDTVGDGEVRKDTLHLVERIISVVRRRRSLKAIETYEQVKFLVAYVDYLRDRAAA